VFHANNVRVQSSWWRSASRAISVLKQPTGAGSNEPLHRLQPLPIDVAADELLARCAGLHLCLASLVIHDDIVSPQTGERQHRGLAVCSFVQHQYLLALIFSRW
jgi:hypothetical protein